MIVQKKANDLSPGDRVRGFTGIPFVVGTLTVDRLADFRRGGVRFGPRIYWIESYARLDARGDRIFDVEVSEDGDS